MKNLLKTLSIGFECPIINFKNENWNEELNSDLIKPHFNFFDILKNDLELLEMPSGNFLLLYTLVVIIDNYMITSKQVDKEWEDLEESISTSIVNYLSKQNVNFFHKLT
jgi:uncharacterized protein YbcC (UPF0753/DUF2309 family)